MEIDSYAATIAKHCVNRESLYLRGYDQQLLTDIGVVALAEGCCRRLRMLNISRCVEVTCASVHQLLQQCRRLRELNMDRAFRLTRAQIADIAKRYGDRVQLPLINYKR